MVKSSCLYKIDQLSVSESAVNCDKCASDFKCCTYRPFIANYIAGHMIYKYGITAAQLQDWDWLPVGLAPDLSYRKKFQKERGWGFGSNESILCSFYEKSSGRCKVWSARPSVCRTFFCKSTYGEAGMSYWNQAEQYLWGVEWLQLEDFMYEKGWTLEEVKTLKNYLSKDYLAHPFKLPQEYKFSDWDMAQTFYLEAYEYINRLEPKVFSELEGKEGQRQFSELLAQRADLHY